MCVHTLSHTHLDNCSLNCEEEEKKKKNMMIASLCEISAKVQEKKNPKVNRGRKGVKYEFI